MIILNLRKLIVNFSGVTDTEKIKKSGSLEKIVFKKQLNIEWFKNFELIEY